MKLGFRNIIYFYGPFLWFLGPWLPAIFHDTGAKAHSLGSKAGLQWTAMLLCLDRGRVEIPVKRTETDETYGEIMGNHREHVGKTSGIRNKNHGRKTMENDIIELN